MYLEILNNWLIYDLSCMKLSKAANGPLLVGGGGKREIINIEFSELKFHRVCGRVIHRQAMAAFLKIGKGSPK